jgi:RNA polymerase sigma factor (sigma-70 family)
MARTAPGTWPLPEWKPLMNNRVRARVLTPSPRALSARAEAFPARSPSRRLGLVTGTDSRVDAAATEADQTATYEAMFVSNLGIVEGVIRFVCQRHKLTASEADEFGAEVRLRLVQNGYEVFRRFQQRSSLRTYLTIVVQRLYLDYRNHLWGKWRPSAEARRLGPVSIRLETLLVRDGLPFDQACEVLRTNEGVTASDSDLAEIAVRLPNRPRRSIVGEDALQGLASTESALEDGILSKERLASARRVVNALSTAVQALADQDRLILRLRFQEGLGVADIARALHLEQKPLYRRFDALLQRLRQALEAAGIDRLEACDIVNREDVDISLALLGGSPGAAGLTQVKGPTRS